MGAQSSPKAAQPEGEGSASGAGDAGADLLSIRNLKTYFYSEDGVAKAIDGIDFDIAPQSTVGLVGESGCGKSVTALSILRLVPTPPGKIVDGKIVFRGQNLLQLPASAMRKIRGKEISMIFQEPMTSLNPVFTIGNQIIEAIRLHQDATKSQAQERAVKLLEMVKISLPQQRIDEYPHQLSGGMKQRAMIAIALACNPTLLIADEPTTALDVTIQAQILDLLDDLQNDLGMSILLITHDLAVVAQVVSYVYVMYAGRIAEHAPVELLFGNPRHPYTWGLFDSIPRPDHKEHRLKAIAGAVPNPIHPPSGCKFHPRCPKRMDVCDQIEPELEEVAPKQWTACHLYD